MQNIEYLNSLEIVEGVTNHASLFSKDEDEEAVEDQEDIIAKRFQDFTLPSSAKKNRREFIRRPSPGI